MCQNEINIGSWQGDRINNPYFLSLEAMKALKKQNESTCNIFSFTWGNTGKDFT